MLKVLLTSGGTRTTIDSVRHIGNMSRGTFGKHICDALLQAGHEVTFLYSKGSKAPHLVVSDLTQTSMLDLDEAVNFYYSHISQYHPIEYGDFDDYAVKLRELLTHKYDVVILCAAVSDYAPVKTEGKISSELDTLTIKLEKTPKLIREVKILAPEAFLVGFKLLVGSTSEQLDNAMRAQMEASGADLVVGNDLRDIKASNHSLRILDKSGYIVEKTHMTGEELAYFLVWDIEYKKG